MAWKADRGEVYNAVVLAATLTAVWGSLLTLVILLIRG